mgnify:CR=1 FL=1
MSYNIDCSFNPEDTITVPILVDEVLLFGNGLDFKVEELEGNRHSWESKKEIKLVIEVENSPEYILQFFEIEDVISFLESEGYSVTQ